jgi:dipeptidyl aminopeptidase/acylaminoacyl peptidase
MTFVKVRSVAAFAVMVWMGIARAQAPVPAAVKTQAPVDVNAFVRQDAFDAVQLSPNGDYFAATVPLEDRTILVVIRRSDNAVMARVGGKEHSVVYDFHWATPDRVLVSLARRDGLLDAPSADGRLYAVSVDGKARYQLDVNEAAVTLDDVIDDGKTVLLTRWSSAHDSKPALVKADVYGGRGKVIATAPIPNVIFTPDATGTAVFVGGWVDGKQRLYYRTDADKDWTLVNDEKASGHGEYPLGFAADGTGYLQVEQPAGPDVIQSWDPKTHARKDALRDPDVDPFRIVYALDGHTPVGAMYMHDGTHTRFFDPASPTARLYRSLEQVFPGMVVRVTSVTRDGKQMLVQVWSDRNPGDFYLYDAAAHRATLALSRRQWLDPEKLAGTRMVQVTARDGLVLHGYLTTPAGMGSAPLPLVVIPHGGPYQVFDTWTFDGESQLLAAAGYAVLRVNYRGSGHYGRAFADAGRLQWGRRMQDDITDATRWAIDQHIADPKRICLVGASYGAYAALMGVAREPDLYRCAVGYVGVYDMVRLQWSVTSTRNAQWSHDWIGEHDDMGQISPTRMAEKIHVPVFLAAGGEDMTVGVDQTHYMESALRKAHVPVETLYYPNEGHGFYSVAHRHAYDVRLLEFLSRSLGGATAE